MPGSMGFSRQEYWSGVPSPSLATRTELRSCKRADGQFNYFLSRAHQTVPSARCPALEGTGGTSDPRVLDRSSPNAGYGLAAPALPKKLYSRRTALPCGQGLRTSLLPKDQEFPPLRGRREQLGACSPFPQQEPKQPLSRAARYTLTLRMAARPSWSWTSSL